MMDQSLTIKEIKQYIDEKGYTHDILTAMKADSRKGVRALLAGYEKNQVVKIKLKEAYESKKVYENHLYKQGQWMIAGIDEAGRGPLAGPVVAGAVILPADFYLPGLDDSKQLTGEKRESYYEIIKQESVSYGIGIIHSKEIDEINVLQATKKAMYQAISMLECELDHILIDAVELESLPCPSTSIIKGDQKSISIAAASVLAKVTRDKWMKKAAQRYPMYGFDQNMGYGTKIHTEALKKYGPTEYHRRSFAPVRDLVE